MSVYASRIVMLLLIAGVLTAGVGESRAEDPGVGASAPVVASKPTLDGAKLYREKTCIACHGPDAKTPILPQYPRLAGQSEAYMALQIRDIKSGARSNGNTAAMRGVLFLVNDEEIDALAHYLSGLKP